MKTFNTKGSVKKSDVYERTPDPIPIPEPPKPPKQTSIFEATCISQAPNPQWIYCKAQDIDGKIAVIIPKRLSGKLVGKHIHIEAISDETGTSYRIIENYIRPNT